MDLKNKMKSRRIKLESQIITEVFNDNNNTVHFDYHVNIDDDVNNIRLDLYTHNAINGEIFLLHQTSGTSSHDVLIKMIAYLRQHRKGGLKNSYTVIWKNTKEADAKEQVSHFFEYSEADVKKKFFYNKRQEDYDFSIQQNPES